MHKKRVIGSQICILAEHRELLNLHARISLSVLFSYQLPFLEVPGASVRIWEPMRFAMVTYVLLEAETQSTLMDLIHYATAKALKFTVSEELRKIFPCKCAETSDSRVEMSGSSADSPAILFEQKSEMPSSHFTFPSLSAAQLLEDANPTSTVKQELDRAAQSWENEPMRSMDTNPDSMSSEISLEERVQQLEATVRKMDIRVLTLEHASHVGLPSTNHDGAQASNIYESNRKRKHYMPLPEAHQVASTSQAKMGEDCSSSVPCPPQRLQPVLVRNGFGERVGSKVRSSINYQEGRDEDSHHTEDMLLNKLMSLEDELMRLSQFKNQRLLAEAMLLGTMFKYENLRREHVLNYGPPFKVVDLNELLRGYAVPKRAQQNVSLQIIDFCRYYFKQACAPDPSDIWNYAYRLSRVSRSSTLNDLPSVVIDTIADFILDALNLDSCVLHGSRLAFLRDSQDSFWLSLGESEEERERTFEELLERKSFWTNETRTLIAQALEDIRYYRLYQGILIPPKKNKDSGNAVGYGRAEKLKMTSEEWKKLNLF
ncbi:unnamed protein product [Cylicocyclus nassatus]|uniref:Uncharacterized protein n=1 Tax=Cylicocyclus nassatus TaxID=53992 RepID=A0AA36GR83_CYLNA|nr:unnamed protein product [Cylicocyclus nassatus]